jgi:hypothetical protein
MTISVSRPSFITPSPAFIVRFWCFQVRSFPLRPKGIDKCVPDDGMLEEDVKLALQLRCGPFKLCLRRIAQGSLDYVVTTCR